MNLSVKLDVIVLDCPDAVALGDFYSRLLGWPVEDGSDADFVTLTPPGGGVTPGNPDGRPTLAFQRVDRYSPPDWPTSERPQQIHLDFQTDDIDAAEPEVLALGATRHPHQPSKDGGFRVFLDPAGHPFCLIR